jgi:hypothetical protein
MLDFNNLFTRVDIERATYSLAGVPVGTGLYIEKQTGRLLGSLIRIDVQQTNTDFVSQERRRKRTP